MGCEVKKCDSGLQCGVQCQSSGAGPWVPTLPSIIPFPGQVRPRFYGGCDQVPALHPALPPSAANPSVQQGIRKIWHCLNVPHGDLNATMPEESLSRLPGALCVTSAVFCCYTSLR